MFFRYNVYSILWALIILSLSTLPPPPLHQVHFFEGADKVFHFFFYFIFAIALFYGFYKQTSFTFLKKQRILLSCSIAGVYGFSIEILQRTDFIGREFDWKDVIANCVGAIFGSFLSYIYQIRLREIK